MTIRISKDKTIMIGFVSAYFVKNVTPASLTLSIHSFTSFSVSAENVKIISLAFFQPDGKYLSICEPLSKKWITKSSSPKRKLASLGSLFSLLGVNPNCV